MAGGGDGEPAAQQAKDESDGEGQQDGRQQHRTAGPDGRAESPPGRRGAPHVVEDDESDDHHAEGRVEPLLDAVGDRVLGGVPVEREEVRAPGRGDEDLGDEVAPQRPGVTRGQHDAVGHALQPTAGEGQDELAQAFEDYEKGKLGIIPADHIGH